MKKILIFLGLMICFIQANAQFDTLRAKAVYVGDIGNQSSVVTEADIASDPSAAFDSLMSESSYASVLKAQAASVGKNYIAMNLFFDGAATNLQLFNAFQRFSVLEPITSADTAHGVWIYVGTASVTPVYNAVNGIALYSDDGTTLTKIAESANDGTIFDNTGWVQVPFTSPVYISKGIYHVNILINLSSGTLPYLACMANKPIRDIFQMNVNYLALIQGSSSNFSATLTKSSLGNSPTIPLVILY